MTPPLPRTSRRLQLGGTWSLPSCLAFFVSEQSSQDFARGALGNNINELNAASKPFVSRFLLLDKFSYISLHHDIALFQANLIRLDHECLRHLASTLVRYWNDSAVCNGGVIEQA